MTMGKAISADSFIPGTYNIGFNGNDETQFTAESRMELLELWIGFCAENLYRTDSVDYVEMVESD